MTIERRDFLAGALATAGLPAAAATLPTGAYGMIGKMTAVPGRRDALAALLIDRIAGMPGCLSYIVAADPADPDTLWITEAWESSDAHLASLTLPAVKDAIAKGRPMIAGMTRVATTIPLGGIGIKG